MFEILPDGRKALILDDKIEAAFILTVGDTDNDGEIGIRCVGAVDIPFDGSDIPKTFFDSKETEKLPKAGVPAAVQKRLQQLATVARIVLPSG